MRLIEIADLVNGVGDRDALSQEDRCLFGALDLADAALGQPGGPARSGTAPSGVTTPAVGLATRCPRAGREQARRCARACRRTSPRSRDREIRTRTPLARRIDSKHRVGPSPCREICRRAGGHESAEFELDPEYFGAFGVMRNPDCRPRSDEHHPHLTILFHEDHVPVGLGGAGGGRGPPRSSTPCWFFVWGGRPSCSRGYARTFVPQVPNIRSRFVLRARKSAPG